MTFAGRPIGWRLLGRTVRFAGRYLYLTLISFGAAMSGLVNYQEILRELTESGAGRSAAEDAGEPSGQVTGAGEAMATGQPTDGIGRTVDGGRPADGTDRTVDRPPELPEHPERPAGHIPPTAEERALWAQLG